MWPACLALHEHFISMIQNPVPRFLVIDQPSQVYFPEAWPSMEEAPAADGKLDRSPDIEGVHRIFAALSAFLAPCRKSFRLLLQSMPGLLHGTGFLTSIVVGNWRRGHDEFLIPNAWLRAAGLS